MWRKPTAGIDKNLVSMHTCGSPGLDFCPTHPAAPFNANYLLTSKRERYLIFHQGRRRDAQTLTLIYQIVTCTSVSGGKVFKLQCKCAPVTPLGRLIRTDFNSESQLIHLSRMHFQSPQHSAINQLPCSWDENRRQLCSVAIQAPEESKEENRK